MRIEVIKLSNLAERAERRNHSFASKLGLPGLLCRNSPKNNGTV